MKEFKCKGCGAYLKFSPEKKHLKCEFCGFEQEIENSETEHIQEHDFESALKNNIHTEKPAGVLEVKCSHCAALVVFKEGIVADVCSFCGKPIVTKPEAAHEMILPESLLPFKIKKNEALRLHTEWIASRWFAPNELKQLAVAGKINGVYLPYWTYDSDTFTEYRGERGTYYYVNETYTEKDSDGKTVTKTRRVRKTRWTPASGTVSGIFDDVLVCATDKLERNLIAALEPWDLKELAAYDDSYIAGFQMQVYTVGLEKGFEWAKGIMKPTIRNWCERDIGGDEQRVHHMNIRYSDVTFKHILLPVWISTYYYRDRSFVFMVNGRTGEVQGNRPYSAAKIAAAVIFVLAIIALALYFYNTTGGM